MITLVDPIGPGLQAALGTALYPALSWLALVAVVGIGVVAALVVRAELASRSQRRSVTTALDGYAFGKPRQKGLVAAPSASHGAR
jgi:hypothetical protein